MSNADTQKRPQTVREKISLWLGRFLALLMLFLLFFVPLAMFLGLGAVETAVKTWVFLLIYGN